MSAGTKERALKTSTHALIVGSAPCSERLRQADLSAFTKIALNKSWALRGDFDIHVGLRFKDTAHKPPPDYQLTRITRPIYNPHLEKAGGNFLCSPSVALIAGFWAVNTQPFKTLSYYGCDLVFDPAKNEGRTHFYGVSDPGPLFNKHPCMRRQDLKSVRLFVWGLMHRVVILNASAETGSLLAFPHRQLEADLDQAYRSILSHPITSEILRLGQGAFAYEHVHRTPAFDGRWGDFARDPDAIEVLQKTLRQWEPVKDQCERLRDVLSH